MTIQHHTRLMFLLRDTRLKIEWEMKGKRNLIGSAKVLTSGTQATGAAMIYSPAFALGLIVAGVGTLCGVVVEAGRMIDDGLKWKRIEHQLLEISRILKQNEAFFHDSELPHIFLTILETLHGAGFICSAVFHAAAPTINAISSLGWRMTTANAAAVASVANKIFAPVGALIAVADAAHHLSHTPAALQHASTMLQKMRDLAEKLN